MTKQNRTYPKIAMSHTRLFAHILHSQNLTTTCAVGMTRYKSDQLEQRSHVFLVKKWS
jgi:hypothetical protein